MKKIFSLLLICPFANAIFDYDRAIIQSQKNNWPAAQELLTHVIVEQPERPDTLYDLGVAAYKNNNFDAALSYFNKTTNHQDTNSQLRQQADFNAGNAHVQLKQLHEAIAAYDHVLDQKSDHKEALHNKEVVKKMLEQEKKQQQNKDQDNEQNKKQEEQDKNEDSKNKNDDNEQQQEKNKDDKQQNQQNKKDQHNEQKKSDRPSTDQASEKNNESETNKKDSDQPDKKDSVDSKPLAGKQEQSNQPKKQSGNQQEQKPTQQEQASTHTEQKLGSQDQTQQLSAGLVRVLEDREKKDAQLNKKMTKALVANQGGSKNDYNCW